MKYKIKWESNAKVETNSKIPSTDIVDNLNDSLTEKNIAAVRLHDMRKTYPNASIHFSGVNSSHSNEDKGHTHYPRLIAYVDTDPKKLAVEFSSEAKNLPEIMKAVNEVVKIVQHQRG
jgi:hypothetical protein